MANATSSKTSTSSKLDLSKVIQFIEVSEGKTGKRQINGSLVIPDGHYIGQLVINAEGLPATAVIDLPGNDILSFILMDLTDLEGDKEYKGMSVSYNASFGPVLRDPKQWGGQFMLESIAQRTARGRKFSSITIDSEAVVE